MDKFVEELPPKEIENFNDLISIKDFESTIKTYPPKNSRPVGFLGKNLPNVLSIIKYNFTQTLSEVRKKQDIISYIL